MNKKQEAALEVLEAAFLECKKAGLVFVGIDRDIEAVQNNAEFKALKKSTSSCEAALVVETHRVCSHGTYLDSGGA